MKTKATSPSFGEQLIASMQEAIDGLNGAPGKITVTTIEVPEPRSFSPLQIQKLGVRLGLDTSTYAKLLGVSPAMLRSWEGGKRKPSVTAARLLEAIHREPSAFIKVRRRKQSASLSRRVA